MAPAGLRDSLGNLPAELTSFVGRRRELADVRALLSRTRLLTLTGMGGVGKTRLARRIAGDVHRAFSGGAWQVELADLAEPALLVPTIAASLGLREQNRRWTITTLQAELKDRQLFVLLDNCEHLIDACAVVVNALLSVCPDLRVLATSREPLGISGEQVVPVRALSSDESMSLFMDRATAAVPDFVLSDHRAAVARLCILLEGVPLAIELAALRLRALSPEQVLEQLERRALPNAASRTAPQRQQSLHALVDWSYRLCTEREQLLWRVLSVFVGGFELDAAEAVCAGSDLDAVELIIGLVEKSVLLREEQAGRVRLRMPEIIRSYGLDRLGETGEEMSVRRQHRDWYVALTARAYQEWIGPDQFGWFSRMRLEHANLRVALDFSLADPGGAVHIVDMVVSLLHYWIAFGLLSDGRHWLHGALGQIQENDLLRMRALRAEITLAALQGDHLAAAALLGESRALAQGAGDAQELAWVVWAEGIAALQQEDLATAADAVEQSRRLFQTAGDIHGLVTALGVLVTVAAASAEPSRALDRANEYFSVAEALGDQWTTSWVLWAVGLAHWRLDDMDKSGDLVIRSLNLRRPFEDLLGSALAIELLAWVTSRKGRPERAARLMGAARRDLTTVGSSLAAFPYLLEDHQRCEAALRTRLGDKAFEAAVDRGALLETNETIALAAGTESARTPDGEGTASAAASPLTPREREIAELVTQGMSNKEIAASLVISQRTAEGHVEHILVKLGFTARSQIAGWVTERRSAATNRD